MAKPPSEAQVERGLAQLNVMTLANFEEGIRGYEQHARIQKVSASGDVCAKCVLLYTSDKIFRPLQNALRLDSEDLLHWMPFISAVNHYISRGPPGRPSVVWRGSKVKSEIAAKLKIGSYWRVPYYLSTSERKKIASNFQGFYSYMIKLNLPEGVGRSIETVSCYPNEAEVLLPPYTAMVLKKKTSSELEYDVLSMAQLREAQRTTNKDVDGKPEPFKLPIPTGPVCKAVPSRLQMRMPSKSGSGSFQ